MRVAITGHRALNGFYDLPVINDRMKRHVEDPEVEEIFFGGALGVDTEALLAAHTHRPQGSAVFLTVVCPDRLKDLPAHAREVAQRCSDHIIELRRVITRDDNWEAYHNRNRFMVDQILPDGQLTAFWNGDRSGTGSTVEYAKTKGACWEWVRIQGGSG